MTHLFQPISSMRFHNLGAYAQSLGRQQIWDIQRRHPVMFPVYRDLNRIDQPVSFRETDNFHF